MPNTKMKVFSLLKSTDSIDLNSVATTSLYTIPTDMVGRVTHVVLTPDADTGACEISMGQSGDTDDWMKKFLLGDHLDADGDVAILEPRNFLQASDTWDAASIAIGDMEAKDVTCDDAELGDFALASLSIDLTDLVLNAQVTAAGVVTCVLANNTEGAVDLGSATVRVRVFKFNIGFMEYTAGEVFTLDVTTAAGSACTCVADVFGYLA